MSGYLSDRYGKRIFVVLGPLLSATFLPLIGVTSSFGGSLGWAIGPLIAVGLVGWIGLEKLWLAMMPAIVVKAQELLPDSAAVSSGIVMGLAWGAGSLGVLVTGALGDWIGPREAAMVSMPALLLGTALALHPRLREGDRI